MIYHILNGDALAYSFPETHIEGEIMVVREALINGDLSGNDLPGFWRSRAACMQLTAADYQQKVVSEFEKILKAPNGTEFNLWFEYDLFCQINMWFVLWLINNLSIKKTVYAVYPFHLGRNDKHFWNGFGPANPAQLQACFAERILLSNADLQSGQELWTACKDNHFEALLRLAKNQSPAFPFLQEVVSAHIDRFPKDGTKGRPESVIEDIIKNTGTDFTNMCKEFWNRESIYGFGDDQLKCLYDKVMRYR